MSKDVFKPGFAVLAVTTAVLYLVAASGAHADDMDENLIVTFSQRKDVFTRAIKAVRGETASLADAAALRRQRRWLPPAPDIELYLGLGQFGRIARGILNRAGRLVPWAKAMALNLDKSTRPVALGIEVDGGGIESGLVIPPEVLAVVIDRVMDQMSKFRLGGGR